MVKIWLWQRNGRWWWTSREASGTSGALDKFWYGPYATRSSVRGAARREWRNHKVEWITVKAA